MQREPTAYEATCPNCGATCSIRLSDSGYYWLAESVWKCPYCKERSNTRRIQEATPYKKEGK